MEANEGTTQRLVNPQIEALVRSRRTQLGLSQDNLPLVLASLTAAYTGDDPLAQIAAASPAQISQATEYLLEGDGAEVLIAAAQRELEARPAAPAADTRPLHRLSFDELIARALADPDKEAVIQAINGLPEVRSVIIKTFEWAMLVNGQLDLAHTKRHLAWLAMPETAFRPFFERDGVKGMAVSLIRAIGQEKAIRYVHPLDDRFALVGGRDNDFDWSGLLANESRYRAFNWARRTGHRFWPAGMDAFTMHEQMTAETLDRRWQAIMDEYEASKAALKGDEKLDDNTEWHDPKAQGQQTAAHSQGLAEKLAELRSAVQALPDNPPTAYHTGTGHGYTIRKVAPASQRIKVYGGHNGDIHAAGQDVEVFGPLNGSIYEAGKVSFSHRASVTGDIIAVEVILSSSNTVGGDINASNLCTVAQGSSVGGDVTAKNAFIYGNVAGDVSATDVTITGTVGGDVSAQSGTNSGTVGGDLIGPVENNGTVGGDIVRGRRY